MPFCCKCGEELNMEDRFCTNCGNMQQHKLEEKVTQKSNRCSYRSKQDKNSFGPTFKIALVLFGAFMFLTIYSNYYVTKPDNVVEDLFCSLNRLDVNSAISCLDPTIEQAYIAAGNITGGLFGVNLADVMDIVPFMPYLTGLTGQEFQETNFQVTIKSLEIDGQKREGLFDSLLFMIDSFVDVFDDEALVYAEIHETETNIRGELIFYLRKFNNHGWRIVDVHELNANYN